MVEEDQLVRIILIGQKHWHLLNYVLHRVENAEEVDKNRASKPKLRIVKQGLAFHDILDRERDPNQGRDHDEAQLPGGEEWRPMNRAYGEFGLGLDEINHRLNESREIAQVHLLFFFGGRGGGRARLIT